MRIPTVTYGNPFLVTSVLLKFFFFKQKKKQKTKNQWAKEGAQGLARVPALLTRP